MSDRFAIRVSDLSHRYPPTAMRWARPRPASGGAGGPPPALDGINFQVSPGEIFGLLGPNGGGKTTLFKILSTLISASSGNAEVFGIDVARDPAAARKKMGIVFQAPALDKKLTVEENLRHQGHLYGLVGTALSERIREKLDRVGLWERRADRVETLSGGLRRRVELAKGFLHRPDLLLLDEPSTGLDPNARREVWNYLQSVRSKEGTTVVLTTHLMDEAEKCDRLAILDRGKLIALDEPDKLKAQIGGDVITATADNPGEIQSQLRQRFGVEAALVDGTLRIEKDRGHEFITRLVETFPGRIQSVRLGKPTLEDVFVHYTGHRFVVDSPDGKEEQAMKEGK